MCLHNVYAYSMAPLIGLLLLIVRIGLESSKHAHSFKDFFEPAHSRKQQNQQSFHWNQFNFYNL